MERSTIRCKRQHVDGGDGNPGNGLVGKGPRRRLLQHQMHIGAAEPKSTDAGQGRTIENCVTGEEAALDRPDQSLGAGLGARSHGR